MSDLKTNFEHYNRWAAKTLLRWNKNYFDALEEFLGNPSEFGDRCKMAWSSGRRKIIYYAEVMTIQLHEQTDEAGVYWKLIKTEHYPTKANIEFYSNWLKEK